MTIAIEEIRNYINLAQKAGLTVPGLDRVKPLFNKGQIGLVLYSPEVGSSAGKVLEFLCKKDPGIPVIKLSGQKDMIFITNKERIKIIGFKKSPLTEEINSRVAAYWSTDGKKI